MMPIVLTILGCCFGAGFGKSLRAGLTVGIGFIGLNLVINSLLGTTLSPAVQVMVERFGLSLTVVDVGWPAAAAIAMASLPWGATCVRRSSRACTSRRPPRP